MLTVLLATTHRGMRCVMARSPPPAATRAASNPAASLSGHGPVERCGVGGGLRSGRRGDVDGVHGGLVRHLHQRQHGRGRDIRRSGSRQRHRRRCARIGEQPARVAVGVGYIIHVAWPARRDGQTVIRYAARRIAAGRSRRLSRWPARRSRAREAGTLWRSVTTARVHVGLARRPERAPMDGARPRGLPHRSAANPSGGPRQDIFHASWKGRGVAVGAPGPGQCLLLLQDRVATAGEHVYAAWRHIYPGSLRDIAVARSTDNGATFGAPIRVSEDGWKIDACPDDGPAMVADGHGGIHIVWPTLVAGDTPRKGIFYSTLSGDAFTPRIRLDSGDGRSRASADSGRRAHEHRRRLGRASWRRRAGSCSGPSSTTSPQPPQMFSGDGASYPVVGGGEGFWIVLWSVQGGDGRSAIEGRRIPSTAKH